MQSLKTLMRKVSNIFSRGSVSLVDDAKAVQELQVSLYSDESYSGVQNVQQYGFSSVPLFGAKCLAGFMGGNRDDGIVVSVYDDRNRPTGSPAGSSCIYDANGSKIILNNNGTISISTSATVTITAPNVVINGNLQVNGNISASQDITDNSATSPKTMSGMRGDYNAHTHIDSSTNPTSTTNRPM